MTAPDRLSPTRSFQGLILTLQNFWAAQGCVILQPYDMEMGAGTFHPATTLRALGPKPWKAAYVQPSRRPKDGRYGENPNRLQHFYQYQVILKPSPPDLQSLYLASLAAIGVDAKLHVQPLRPAGRAARRLHRDDSGRRRAAALRSRRDEAPARRAEQAHRSIVDEERLSSGFRRDRLALDGRAAKARRRSGRLCPRGEPHERPGAAQARRERFCDSPGAATTTAEPNSEPWK